MTRACLALACCAILAQQAPDPLFREAAAELANKTKIAVRLPARMPNFGQTDQLYPVIEAVSSTGYSVIVGYTDDCEGGNACRFGDIAAEPAKGRTPRGKPVSLVRGLKGFFTDAHCGAVCSDSEVRWREGDTIYMAGIKAGSEADVVKLANACLEASPKQ